MTAEKCELKDSLQKRPLPLLVCLLLNTPLELFVVRYRQRNTKESVPKPQPNPCSRSLTRPPTPFHQNNTARAGTARPKLNQDNLEQILPG